MAVRTSAQALAGVAGALFVALSASAEILVPQMPQAGAPTTLVLAYIEANQRTLEWTWFLSSEVAWVFGLYLCACLTVILWTSSPYRAAVLAGLSGAVVTATLTVGAGIPWGLLVYLGPHLTNGDLVLALAETRHFADAALSFSTSMMLLGFSVAATGVPRSRFRVLAAGGLLATALQLIHGADDFMTSGQTGILPRLAPEVALGWFLAASAVLLIRWRPVRGRRIAGRERLTQRPEVRAGSAQGEGATWRSRSIANSEER
jgi:hypothetical protein